MNARTCPTCGTPLGAGALEGLCPKCLVIDGSSANTTMEAVAAAEKNRPARARAGELASPPGHTAMAGARPHVADAPPAGRPKRLAIGLANPDEIAREAKDAAEAGRAAATWPDRTDTPAIEGYDILREVKHGGQGIVYLAVQRSTKRKVAIKVLLAGRYASKSARRRFEREIELVASLKHPNIIAVFDSGTTEEGYEYYVMDYVRGVPAAAYVREKKLTLEETLAMFATVCDAVSHAHQRGVIHRDLKPSNVLIDVDGNVRVLDFGLAKALTDPVNSQVSVTGNVVGTLPYMSPEQTRGNPDEIDTRTDVYALGVMLYQMLTGRHPYPTTGDIADIIRNITEMPPGRPAKCWTSESGVRTRSRRSARGYRADRCPLDFEVETIVLKALAKEREHRYDSAGQFARDIRRYLSGEQIVARRASAWYQLRVFSRRNKPLVGAAAAILLVLVAAVVVVSWQLRAVAAARGDAARKADAMGNLMAAGGDYFADRNDFFTARRLYTTALDQTTERGHPGTSILIGLYEVATRPEGGLPLLGSYGRGGGAGGFRGHTSHAKSVVVLSDDTALTAGDDGRLIHFDLPTGRTIQAVDVRATRTPAGDGTLSPLWLGNVAVSPDEKYVAVGSNTGDVILYSRGSSLQETGVVLPHPRHEVWMVTLTNDLRVLTGTNRGWMKLWDGKTGQLLQEFQEVQGGGDASVAGLAFWPGDERYALSGCGDGNVRVWDLQKKVPIETISGKHKAGEQVNCVAFNRDGTKALTASFDQTVIVWDVVRTEDGPRLVMKLRFDKHKRAVWRAAFSPDGKTVASASNDGVVRVWDAATGVERFVFRGQAGKVDGVAFWGYDRVVSTGDGSPDEDTGRMTSALKVWGVGRNDGLQATAKGQVTGITVDDNGVATVQTSAGVETMYAGEDGTLHASRTTAGPAAMPARPAVYATSSDPPHWGGGGRSAPASESVGDSSANASGPAGAGKDLATLSGGRGKLVGRADRKLQLFGTPNAAGSAGGGAGSGAGAGAGGLVLLRTLEGHRGSVDFAAVSPNGRFIVSADSLRTVRVWDVMRPARCRELERQMAAAYNGAERDPTSPFPYETLRNWYAFCGRDKPISDLQEREKLIGRATTPTAR